MTDDELFILFCIAVGSLLTWATTGLVVWITVLNTKRIQSLAEELAAIDRDLARLESTALLKPPETIL